MKAIRWDGKQIKEPGIYSDVPLDTYHGQAICPGPSVSSSNLRRVLEINGGSPAHMYAESSLNPNRLEPADNKAFILGRAAHHLMLGQPHFAKSFAIRPDEFSDYRSKAAREWRDAQIVKGVTPLTGDDVEAIRGMAASLGNHPLVKTGLLAGDVERSLFWQDKKTGIWLKSRPDAIPTDSGDAADLKTTPSVSWTDLIRSITDFAYHAQAALVSEAFKVCLGLELTSFSLVFVEKKAPYCARVVMLKDSDIELGAKQNRLALDLIARCIAEKHWPGPGEDHVTHIELSQRYRELAEAS